MPSIDFKTFVTLLSLLAAGVSSVISIKTDIAEAKSNIAVVTSDIAEIRSTQLSSSVRIEKLYEALLASNLASAK